MPLVPPSGADVPNPVVAALLLSASSRMAALALPHPSPKAIFEATGAKRSQSYLLSKRLEELLVQVTRRPGRPPKPAAESSPARRTDVVTQVRDFIIEHPGCVTGSRARRRYSDSFRRFVLTQVEAHPNLPRDVLAEATAVPLGTLKDWLAGGAKDLAEAPAPAVAPATPRAPADPHIQTVLDEWSTWDGGFVPFCEHLQRDCQIPFGRTLISTILEGNGVRLRKRRQGRSPDELALRGQLETFFPHAQWVGDGTAIPVDVDGELHVFNLELDVDAYSGAFVGAHVSEVEDSEAVIATFRDAIAATGRKPLALLLDNKPSNHCPAVDEALGENILRMRATSYRPQNKAHVEGGFGLLKPTLDGLTLEGGSPAERAESFLRALIIATSRAINHRPRRDRGGRSRVDLLGDEPTPEDIERARAALAERMRQQEHRRNTLAARQNPVVRAIITAAFKRLELLDPNGHFLTAIARYPVEAVVEGIAIFEGRHLAGTLPTADVRYLLGIVRNIAEEREGWEIAEALWKGRVDAQGRLARHLRAKQHQVDAAVDPRAVTDAYLDHALTAPSRHERFFWLNATADWIRRHPADDHERLCRLAARRIHVSRAVPHRDRLAATRYLAGKLRPLN